MTITPFHLIAEVSSDSDTAIGPVLEQLVGGTVIETLEGFHMDGWLEGADVLPVPTTEQPVLVLQHDGIEGVQPSQ